MSMASGHDVRQSYRQTPDSVRNSYLHLASTGGAGGSSVRTPDPGGPASRNGTPPVDKEGEIFR